MRRSLLLPLLLGLLVSPAQAQSASLPLRFGPPAPTQVGADERPACPVPTAPLEKAVWDVVQQDEQARQGTGQAPDLSCGNRLDGLLSLPVGTDGADVFSVMLRQVRGARSEVLISNMFIESLPGTPGWELAQAIRDLYAKVKADPASYPEGMTVRVSQGGMPQFMLPSEALVLRFGGVLRSLGVPFADPGAGWKLELGDYRFFPHSHVKMHVIDGQQVVAGGYNISAWYLPGTREGGHDLHDLGLAFSGPVARAGVATFDDLWTKSRLLVCPPLVRPERLRQECRFEYVGAAPPHPASTLPLKAAGQDRAWWLYRRARYSQANDAVLALIRQSRSRIDLMQADYSVSLGCLYAFKGPNLCPANTLPAYFQELIRAAERGVKIRVLTVDYDVGQLWNRSGIAIMREALRRRGLEDRFEARYTRFKMHTKASTFDREMLVVGSLNFHFSSWNGWSGVNEAALATSSAAALADQQRRFDEAWNSEQLSRPAPPEPWLGSVGPALN